MFFSPTFYKDDTYEAIRKYLDKKGILWKGYTDIRNEDGVDYIDNFMRMNRENENKDENRQDEPENKLIEPNLKPVQPVVNFGDELTKRDELVNSFKKAFLRNEDELVNSFKPENPTKPEFILVFDDMSRYLREKSVIELLKNSRHFRCKIIMSTQSITDLHPHGHSQFDYIALFKNFNEDSLEKIYDRIEPNISFEKFKEIYHETTKKPEKRSPKDDERGKRSPKDERGFHNFLLIDRGNEKYRINLDKEIIIK